MKAHRELPIKSLEDFWDYLPPMEYELCKVLDKLLLENIPKVQSKLSFKVPYYLLNNNTIAFIWPGVIPWGGIEARQVSKGFLHG